MARPTLSDYLTYMGKAPRTKGWGALLVYDRAKANMLLMQEHILRGEQGAWIEPVSGEKETENGKFTRLSDFAFGAPVLSFENANIGSSMAALTMPVVSGKITEWSREQGASQATLVGISNLDPLTAPRVKMNIKLNEGNGGVVGEDGRVILDLSSAASYYFEVSQWKELNVKLGELIQEKFNDPERGEQVWELNKLAPAAGGLNPTSFRVRTHSLAKAGTTVPSTNKNEQEEGAVIVGVALNGDSNGDFPSVDGDMPYLLPARQSGADPYTLNIVINHDLWFRKVLDSLLVGVPGYNHVPLKYDKDERGFLVSALGGSIDMGAYYSLVDEPKRYLYIDFIKSVGALRLAVLPEGVRCSLDFDEILPKSLKAGVYAGGQWNKDESDIRLALRAECLLAAAVEEGTFILKREDLYVDGAFTHLSGEELEGAFGGASLTMRNQLRETFDSIAGKIEVIDLLRLNGLLFRNNQRSVADTLNIPGDVSMLGDLAPTLTSFAIDPLNKTLVAGGPPQKLTLVPRPQESVTWTVKAADNGSTDKALVGEIVDGLYKAPEADKIPGTFRNVIVTATAGENSSSAQFTIVPKAVAVRPNLLSARFSTESAPQRYVLEGGSVESVLTWGKGANFKGELRDPTPAEYDELLIPRDKNCKVYVAPLKEPGSGQDKLMQLDQVQVTGAGRTETIDINIAWSPVSATLKATKVGDTLKLTLAVESWEGGEQELKPEETQWYKVLGTGLINDATGIYTPGANEGDYVIIAGVAKLPGALSWNYSVLPMPYTEADAQTFAEVNESFNRLHAARS